MARKTTSPQSIATGGLTITAVAQRTGISAPVLRIWELRYGWPCPERGPNGYRLYPEALVAILQEMKVAMQKGRTIGELLQDPTWQQIMETGRLPTPVVPRPRPRPNWGSVPIPESAYARDVRSRLERGLLTADTKLIDLAQAMAYRLHPAERERAVGAIMRLWNEGPSRDRETVPTAIRREQLAAVPDGSQIALGILTRSNGRDMACRDGTAQ